MTRLHPLRGKKMQIEAKILTHQMTSVSLSPFLPPCQARKSHRRPSLLLILSLSPADRRGSAQFDGQLTTGASSQETSWPGSRVTQSRLTRLTWTWRSPLTEILSNPASVPVLKITLTLVSQPFSAQEREISII